MCLADIDINLVDPKFLQFFFQLPSVIDGITTASLGTTNRQYLKPQEFLDRVRLRLPPLREQRQIVTRIEELAAKINEARGLQRVNREEVEALSRAFLEEAFRELSDRFPVKLLGDVYQTITDGDHNTPQFCDDGVRFIFVGNVSSGRLHFENSKLVSHSYFNALRPQRVPERGDILYSAVGATLGIPAIVDTDESFCFQRHVAILKLDRQQMLSNFVWHMLRSRTVFAQTWSSTTGSAQPTVPLRAIRELPIPVPPLCEQHEIAVGLDALQAQVDAVKKLQSETSGQLDALLPSFLDKALNGNL